MILGLLTSKDIGEAQKIYLWESEAKPVPKYYRFSTWKLNPIFQHIYIFSSILDTSFKKILLTYFQREGKEGRKEGEKH